MSRAREWGGALPAVMVLLLVLLVVGMQIAMAAIGTRLTAARMGAAEEAYRAAESAIQLAAGAGTPLLRDALEDGTGIPLDGGPVMAEGAGARVTIRDDDDGDGRPTADSNGRVLLHGEGWSRPLPGADPSFRHLMREALVAGWLPLPASLVDCTAGVAICGGDAGCPVPAVRLDGLGEVGLAVPAGAVETLRLRVVRLGREVLRQAEIDCVAGAGSCDPEQDRLRVAAASAIVRRLDDPAGDALGLDDAAVSRLVANLLVLEGSETGPAEVLWWDGSIRLIPAAEALVGVLESLGQPTGHTPDLTEHPLPRVLDGRSDLGPDRGVCLILPPLVEAALRVARELPGGAVGPSPGPPPVEGTFVLSRRVSLPAGTTLTGRGLLILLERLEIPATAELRWSGSVVLAGGQVAGEGRVVAEGSVLVAGAGPSGAGPGVDLERTAWSVRADSAVQAMAWEAAGVVLLSQWEAVAGE